MPDTGMKLLIFLPAAGLALFSGLIFMVYARQRGLAPERASTIGLWLTMGVLFAGIGIALLVLYRWS